MWNESSLNNEGANSNASPSIRNPKRTRTFSTDFTFSTLRAISVALSILCWESTVPLSLTTPFVVVTLIWETLSNRIFKSSGL